MNPWMLARAGVCGALFAAAQCSALGASMAEGPPGSASAPAPVSLPSTLSVRRDDSTHNLGFAWTPLAGLGSLALGAGAWWAWTRRVSHRKLRGAAARPAAIVRLSSQALTPQASVHALAWNGEEYLVACTSQQVALLARRPLHSATEEGT